MKKKKIPFSEDYNMSNFTIENSSCTTDCTGLIPFAAGDDLEYYAYSNIYQYSPEEIVEAEQ